VISKIALMVVAVASQEMFDDYDDFEYDDEDIQFLTCNVCDMLMGIFKT